MLAGSRPQSGLRRVGAALALAAALGASGPAATASDPPPLERNIAGLEAVEPGAGGAVVWTTESSDPSPAPTLSDGDVEHPATLPGRVYAIGCAWSTPHAVDGAALSLAQSWGDPRAAIVEVHDGRRWRAPPGGVTCKVSADSRRVEFAFEPAVTRLLRIVFPSPVPAVTELEVYRYLPPDGHTWPARLVEGNQLEREVLRAGREPAYEDLCLAAHSMRPARALLGLKDLPTEVGVTWDGRIIADGTLELRFGAQRAALADVPDTVRRVLVDGWRPGTIVAGRLGDLGIRETAFVAYLEKPAGRPTMCVRAEVANLGNASRQVPVEVALTPREGAPGTPWGACLVREGKLLLAAAEAPAGTSSAGHLTFALSVPAGETRSLDLALPNGELPPREDADRYRTADFDAAFERFRAYWDDLLAPAMRLDLPEEHLERAYRAILAQLFINADGDIMPYGAYPSCYDGGLFGVEEGWAMLALAYAGFQRDAQRYMDATYLTPEFLRKSATYTGYEDRHQQYRNGLQPYYAATAYMLGRDRRWITGHLPLLRECAEWTVGERRKTMALESGERPLHWGLLPPWAYGGDIGNVLGYALYGNFACWRGLLDTAWLLGDLGQTTDADRYRADADDYRVALERAVDGNVRRDRDPVFLPLQLYATAPVGNDYDQLFDGCLLDVMPFDLRGPQVSYITDSLDRGNLTFCLLPRFKGDVGAGGLDGLYGLGYVLTKLRQGRVPEFLLGLYGYAAFNLEREVFTGRETNAIYASDVHLRTAYPGPDMSDPLPCGSAVLIHYLRNMLVTEKLEGPGLPGQDLLLLAGAPRAWFGDGQTIRVRGAPTYFGEVSFEVISHLKTGRVDVRLTPPSRDAWRAVRIRLPHPDGRAIRGVLVDGEPCADVSADGEWVVVRPGRGTLRISVEYE